MKGTFLFVVLIFHSVIAEQICSLSQQAPAAAKYQFQMCRRYENKACCVIGHDEDMENNFAALMDVGIDCPYIKRNKSPELYEFMCLGCDPNQPKFVRDGNAKGTNGTILVCQEFVNKLWGEDGSRYDACGVRISSTVVIPSVLYSSAEEFLNAIPNSMNTAPAATFYFKVVNASELQPGEVCFNEASKYGISMVLLLLFVIIAQIW